MSNKSQKRVIQDRISSLPKELRQHILSFLPIKDAISTSILSTIWRYDWLYLPNLIFDRSFFDESDNLYMLQPEQKQAISLRYLDFLEHIFTMRKSHEPIIFLLKLFINVLPELFPRVASFLSQLEVDMVHLRIRFGGSKTIISTEFLKSVLATRVLSELCIDQGTLSVKNSLVFPSRLRKLTLCHVYMDDVELGALIASCTSLESLCFEYCSGFSLLKVSELLGLRKLKILDDQKNITKFEIDAPNLDSLVYRLRSSVWLAWTLKYSDFVKLKKLVLEDCNLLDFNGACMVHLETLKVIGCINVDGSGVVNSKDLSTLVLESCDISDDWINEWLLELGNLKVLSIAHCDLLENLKISLDALGTLSLLGCEKLCTLDVSCPSLCEFTYVNMYNLIFLVSETDFSPTSVDVYLPYWQIDSTEHVKLSELFKRLIHCKTLTLRGYYIEDMLILRKIRQCYCPPLSEVKHMKLLLIEKRPSSPSLAKILEPLIWLFPRLETMQLEFNEPESSISIKFLHNSNTSSGVISCGCYGSRPIHCWKHSVTNFLIRERKGFTDDYSIERFYDRVIHEKYNS